MTRETRKRELEIGIGLVLYLLAFLISMQAKMKSKAEMLLFLLPYIVSAISIYKAVSYTHLTLPTNSRV